MFERHRDDPRTKVWDRDHFERLLNCFMFFKIQISKEIVCIDPYSMKLVKKKLTEDEFEKFDEHKFFKKEKIQDCLFEFETPYVRQKREFDRLHRMKERDYHQKKRFTKLSRTFKKHDKTKMSDVENLQYLQKCIDHPDWKLKEYPLANQLEMNWKQYFEDRTNLDAREDFPQDDDTFDDEDYNLKKSQYRKCIRGALKHIVGINKEDKQRILNGSYLFSTFCQEGGSTYYGNKLRCRIYSVLGNGDYVDFEVEFHSRSRMYSYEYSTSSWFDLDEKLFFRKAFFSDLDRMGVDVGELKDIQHVFSRIVGRNVLANDVDLVSGAILRLIYVAAGLEMPLIQGDSEGCDRFQQWIFFYMQNKYEGMNISERLVKMIDADDMKLACRELKLITGPKIKEPPRMFNQFQNPMEEVLGRMMMGGGGGGGNDCSIQ